VRSARRNKRDGAVRGGAHAGEINLPCRCRADDALAARASRRCHGADAMNYPPCQFDVHVRRVLEGVVEVKYVFVREGSSLVLAQAPGNISTSHGRADPSPRHATHSNRVSQPVRVHSPTPSSPEIPPTAAPANSKPGWVRASTFTEWRRPLTAMPGGGRKIRCAAGTALQKCQFRRKEGPPRSAGR